MGGKVIKQDKKTDKNQEETMNKIAQKSGFAQVANITT